jgi:hypothetical protein
MVLHSVFDKKKVHYSHHNISDEMDLWSHVKSLYQTTSSTCLYGKNNILKKLVMFLCQLRTFCCLLTCIF